MKKIAYIIGIILFILLLTFTGCKKDRFLKDVEGTHHVTYVMGTASYNCDMIVTYQESDDLFIITLTSGEDFIGQDVVLKGIRNDDTI
ncbi:MAG: hypothetical protein C0596_09855 [Marinilabiliales bacterium]|nr:MAG: hypothetical protein C0596_09855 [Marinilabiliales bacterium]